MKNLIETERLSFRELVPFDAHAMFELNSDPEVVKYAGDKPLANIEQARQIVEAIRRQYLDFGIGRWAAILKETNEFIGWAGLRYIEELNGRHGNYDLGYRFLKKHWGKGYGTESAMAFIDFGFNEMQLECISAYADIEHVASLKILEKCGLKFTNTFFEERDLCAWYEIKNPRILERAGEPRG